MKVVLQRVKGASVSVDGEVIGRVLGEHGVGLMILIGVEKGDTEQDSAFLAQKTLDLRIFSDSDGKMNLSVVDAGGSILVISQFTLIADWKKGRRPGFSRAASPDEGNRLYEHFVEQLRSKGMHVETGKFGADMHVALTNDGPVTLLLESRIAEEQKSSG